MENYHKKEVLLVPLKFDYMFKRGFWFNLELLKDFLF